MDTGQKVWTHEYKRSPNWGGMVVTAGDVVFTGGTSDRKFHAFDAATGKLLWEFPMNSGALAPPSSFSVGGKQYVAVETGWGGDSRGMQATLRAVPSGSSRWSERLRRARKKIIAEVAEEQRSQKGAARAASGLRPRRWKSDSTITSATRFPRRL